MEHLPNPESNAEIVRKLQKYLDNGMLLHGSKKLLTRLEPRQSTDDNPERNIGKSLAIYAEAHDLRIPVLMALFAQADTSVASWQSGYSAHGPDTPIEVSGENYTFTPGYIYVLPREKFVTEEDENEREYIATEPVDPVEVLEVTPSILSEFDDITYI